MQPAWLEEQQGGGIAAHVLGARAEAKGMALLRLLKGDVSEADEEFARVVSTEAPDSEESREEDLEASPSVQSTSHDVASLPLPPLVGAAPGLGSPTAIGLPPPEWAGVFTVMMRNLPNKFTQQLLVEALDTAGFWGLYDFLYLPIDSETNANKGYAFLNFVDPSYAWIFRSTFEGRKLGQFNSNKVVNITPAALQGFEANYAHYSSSRVSRGDPAMRPLFLRQPLLTAKQSSTGAETSAKNRRGRVRRSRNSLIDAAAKQQQRRQVESLSAVGWPVADPLAAWAGSPMLGTMPCMIPPVLDYMQACADTEAPASRPDVRFCHACGSKMQQSHVFCCQCGTARIDL